MIALCETEFDRAMSGDVGFCLACKAEATVYEPDARNLTCDDCGERQVFSAMELLLRGALDIREGAQ